jgi:hypothetical protein
MVNITPPTVKDKDLADECTKIRKSVWTAIDAIRKMANSEVPNVSFARCVSDWQGQVARIKHIHGKYATCTMKKVDFLYDCHVMLQGFRQLHESV